MSPAEHLTSARTAMEDGFDERHRIGGRLDDAERHLAAIQSDAREAAEARRLRQEVEDRRARAVRRQARIASEDARHPAICAFNLTSGLAANGAVAGEVHVMRDPMPSPYCSGNFGRSRGARSLSLSVIRLPMPPENELRQLFVGFGLDQVPLDEDLDLAHYSCIEAPGDTGCLRSSVRLQVGDRFYGMGSRGTRGTMRVTHVGSVWNLTLHGELGPISGDAPPVAVAGTLRVHESIAHPPHE